MPASLNKHQSRAWPAPTLLHHPPHHHILDLADGRGGVQFFGAYVHAIHDGVAAEQTIRVFQIIQTLAGGLVARVGDETVGLQ